MCASASDRTARCCPRTPADASLQVLAQGSRARSRNSLQLSRGTARRGERGMTSPVGGPALAPTISTEARVVVGRSERARTGQGRQPACSGERADRVNSRARRRERSRLDGSRRGEIVLTVTWRPGEQQVVPAGSGDVSASSGRHDRARRRDPICVCRIGSRVIGVPPIRFRLTRRTAGHEARHPLPPAMVER